tara:strand:+ start:102 stop:332 length:231 start_codon:yes stop_codon:yes gene_type:complete
MSEQTKGQRVREVRTSLGLTQVEFAAMLGVTQPFLTSVENDKKKPSETLIKFIELIATLQPSQEWIKLNAPALLGR